MSDSKIENCKKFIDYIKSLELDTQNDFNKYFVISLAIVWSKTNES